MRGKTSAALLAIAATALLLVPAVSAADMGCGRPTACPKVSTPTSLYFHIFDIFNAFPINTQMPDPGFFEVGGTNFPSVVEPNSGTNYDFNTIYGYSTSGPVEYDFIENGQPRFHPERGIAADVHIDTQAPAVLRLYVAPKDVVGATFAPNYMPSYTFRFEMREKNVLDTDELSSGKLIMSGELTQHLASAHFNSANLNGSAHPVDGHMIRTPNADGVVDYTIPLTIETGAIIPKMEGYHVRIDWFQNPSDQPDQDDRVAEGYIRLVMDETYHPRLDLSILNPVYIDFIHPQVAAGRLLIHTAENSPWGTYDIDVANITVEVKDSKGNPVEANLQQIISQNKHVHNLHDKSAEVTYLWRYREEGIPDGTYSIRVEVQNLAKTATAIDEASFVLEGKEAYGIDERGQTVSAAPNLADGDQDSPGAGLAVLAVLGIATFLARRRIHG